MINHEGKHRRFRKDDRSVLGVFSSRFASEGKSSHRNGTERRDALQTHVRAGTKLIEPRVLKDHLG